MKKIAFHLPQFHSIPENDLWWGKDFTEWTNVKKARSLFRGHYQPKTPLNGHYYDLSKSADLLNQIDLAKKYKIDGFCFYHYYFGNGRRLLEKPLETFHQLNDSLEYCLCWANESWTRRWDGKENVSLIIQSYGDDKEWDKHFDTLEKHFLNQHYIKLHEKPIFLIYKAQDIPNFAEMVSYFDSRAKKLGLKGIEIVCVVKNLTDELFFNNQQASKYKVIFEPFYSISTSGSLSMFYKHKKSLLRSMALGAYNMLSVMLTAIGLRKFFTIKYAKITEISIKNATISDDKFWPGLFVDWDNSARRGSRGIIFDGFSVENFKRYCVGMSKALKRSSAPFIFINAWNEWAEGTYLEPDNKYGYEKLKVVRDFLKDTD
jgi:hypothetical protein